MSRSFSLGSRRVLLVAVASLLLGLSSAVAGASAATTTAGPLGLTHFVSLRSSSTGVALRLSCSSTDGQGCSGAIFLTSDETRQGKKVIAVGTRNHRTRVSVRLGQASFSLAAGATATFRVKLDATGFQLLRKLHTFSAWVLANEAMAGTSTLAIFLLHSTVFSEPRHKHK